MANAEREIQRSHELISSARELVGRFENVSKRYHQVLTETVRLQERIKWQRFFGYEKNAIEFFEKLDRNRTSEKRTNQR